MKLGLGQPNCVGENIRPLLFNLFPLPGHLRRKKEKKEKCIKCIYIGKQISIGPDAVPVLFLPTIDDYKSAIIGMVQREDRIRIRDLRVPALFTTWVTLGKTWMYSELWLVTQAAF